MSVPNDGVRIYSPDDVHPDSVNGVPHHASVDEPSTSDVSAKLDDKVDLESCHKEIKRLQTELDEARSLVAVANYSLEESLETERRKCQEEVATLQQLMKENIEEAVRKTQERNDVEIRRLKNQVTRLELELQDLRSTVDKENPFSAVTKLARKVGSLTNPTSSPMPSSNSMVTSEACQDDYLEQSMKKAQEDVEVLRSLVLPLEEEIKALKDKLRTTDEQLQVYENIQADLVRGTELLSKLVDNNSLESVLAELPQRPDGCDLKSISQDDRLKIFIAISNAQRVILTEDKERLRTQLQDACKLLENERRQCREMRRNSQKIPFESISVLNQSEERTSSKGFPIKEKIGPFFSRISPVLKRKTSAHSPSREMPLENGNESRSILDPKFGQKINHSFDDLNTSSLNLDCAIVPVEVQSSPSEKSCPCSQCQTFIIEIDQLQADKTRLEKQLTKSREESERLSNLIKDIEHKWTEVAKDYEKQVDSLSSHVEELQAQLKKIASAFRQFRNQVQETLREMNFDRETVSSELCRLQKENDFLVGKHSQHAEQLQNETINLPDSVQDLQFVCLKLREDVITAKVAKEALEKRWQTEILMLKDQMLKEQHSKETLENSLTREIDFLREQLGMMRSVHTQLDEESNRKASLEAALEQTKAKLKEFQEQTSEAIVMRAKLENEIQHLKSRVSTLQADLETSEAVQRDFVQLSQQLQVQLEKIRQSEKELRWQYEEDVDSCSECRQLFGVSKRKHHCRHCFQIFCGDCLRKSVTSGPNKRQSRVCNVCYYLLVPDSAPFFSSEPQLLN